MEPLNIVFSRSSNPFAAAIRAYPPSGPYSHTSIWLPEKKILIEALASKKGVVFTPENEFRQRVSVAKLLSINAPEVEQANEWAESTKGDLYDWSYVFSVPFRVRDWQKEGAWACSEHCAMYCIKAGIDIIAPGMHGITPNHLYSLFYAAGAREKEF